MTGLTQEQMAKADAINELATTIERVLADSGLSRLECFAAIGTTIAAQARIEKQLNAALNIVAESAVRVHDALVAFRSGQGSLPLDGVAQ